MMELMYFFFLFHKTGIQNIVFLNKSDRRIYFSSRTYSKYFTQKLSAFSIFCLLLMSVYDSCVYVFVHCFPLLLLYSQIPSQTPLALLHFHSDFSQTCSPTLDSQLALHLSYTLGDGSYYFSCVFQKSD